jgi:hypothetical protein
MKLDEVVWWQKYILCKQYGINTIGPSIAAASAPSR